MFPPPQMITWSFMRLTLFMVLRLLYVLRRSIRTNAAVISANHAPSAVRPPASTNTVKMRPVSLSGWTSWYPTAVIVMIAM